MPLHILYLMRFDGPNRFDPRPGVMARLHADRDMSRRLRAALKDAAQRVGLVIGSPDIQTSATDGGMLHELFFMTPMPAIGAAALEYCVKLLNARQAEDEEWDEEEPLWDLQKRRRAEALPLRALQLVAEASTRGIPAFLRADGQLQLGYGAHGRALDLSPLRERGPALREGDIGTGAPLFAQPADESVPDWSALGYAPIIAMSGGPVVMDAAATLDERLRHRLPGVVLAQNVSFDETRAHLTNPAARAFVFGLEAGDLLRRGLPFDRCLISALASPPESLIEEAGSGEELARALGVALLVTDSAGMAILDADDAAILALAEFAPCPLILMAQEGDHPALLRHRALGERVVFLRDGAVISAHGSAETITLMGEIANPAAVLLAAALDMAIDSVNISDTPAPDQ